VVSLSAVVISYRPGIWAHVGNPPEPGNRAAGANWLIHRSEGHRSKGLRSERERIYCLLKFSLPLMRSDEKRVLKSNKR